MTLRDRFRGLTLAESLELRAREHPTRPFVAFGEQRLTYGQVDQQAAALASALHELGIEAGDRIALTLPNWPEFVVSAFAAAKLGAVIVPLNPRFTPPELQYALRHSESVAVVTAENWGGIDYLARFEQFLGVLPDLQYVLSVGKEDLWYDDRIHQFEDLVSSGEGRPFPRWEGPSDALFAIVYTSGTMGKPKGVALTHENLMSNAATTAEAIGLTADDVVFGVNTLFNVFGIGTGVLGTMAAGASLVLDEGLAPAEALATVEREGVTVIHGVPTNFILALNEPTRASRNLSSLRTGIVAGAPVTEELAQRIMRDLVPGIRVGYGMTETGNTVSVNTPDDPRGKQIATVGRPLDGTQVRVIDADGSVLPVESVGEVAIKGPGVMQGYYRQPGETAQVFTPDGFFLTGDLGMVDEEGYVHLIGRRKEMIIRGGFNVYPREVEDRLHAHPAVLDVAVVGLPDEILGEKACACIVPVEGAIVTGEEIRDFCREVLADYKVPDLVRFLDGFPLTGSGKVRRVELARMINAEESSRR
ncbi:class I adenylate-forming enzyme family protein [Longimicrobium sp.]|jgi:fatty-acyl-CoA synthase|uniref:class I adenylate-forming enzyme family protein n=1 Tax=Longimicrobium sp. TaxID=2029185 RepID=UPI002ED7DF5D